MSLIFNDCFLKNKNIYIILMYFWMKSILKSNYIRKHFHYLNFLTWGEN